MELVIVGNGSGGFELARNLAGDFNTTIVEEETVPHYPKPLLSRYIAGFISEERLFYRPPSWYEERGINLRLGRRALRIDRGKKVLITTGEDIKYDILVIATGARARAPQIPGKEHVMTLRRLEDARTIRERLESEGEITVLGGGFIAIELAGNLASAGYSVTLIHRSENLLRLDGETSGMIKKPARGVGS